MPTNGSAIMGMLSLAGIAACDGAPKTSPELLCQERIAAALSGDGDAEGSGDAFAAEAARWRALDRNGCTSDQGAAIDGLAKAAGELSALSAENEEVGRTNPDGAAHMAAFQAFNDALIAYDDLGQAEKTQICGDAGRLTDSSAFAKAPPRLKARPGSHGAMGRWPSG
jgi:hypothetical protein